MELSSYASPEGRLYGDPDIVDEKAFLEHEVQIAQTPENEIAAHHNHDDTSFKSLLAGGVGGTLEVLTDHPIDLVKVRMQTAGSAPLVNGVRQPHQFLPILSQVIRNEGLFSGLFQGVSVRIASHMPSTAVSFWGYDLGQKLVRLYGNNSSKAGSSDLSISQLTMAGAFSGIPVTMFETPLERIKCLLQTQARSSAVLYQGPLDCGMQVFQQSGVSGLYRGFGITAARNVPGFGVWFGTYELFKHHMNQNNIFGTHASSSWMSVILSGGIAGSASWLVMIPFDAVKSVVQTSPHQISALQAYRQVTARSQLALFRGIGPTVLIAFPANAACFLGAEMAWSAMSLF